MQMLTGLRNCTMLLAAVGFLASCNKSTSRNDSQSSVTGWKYNDKKTGGFTVAKPKDIKTGPGLIFVQGGTFTMGASQEDVIGDWNNIPKRVTVNSFFIDKTEVANVHYREYIFWVENTFGDDDKYKQAIQDVKPDTLVWRSELAYNEPYVEYYFRHPSYNYYPVVGVTWKQAHDFCIWRTDRVNEKALLDRKVLDPKDYEKGKQNGVQENNFNTKSYLMGLHTPKMNKSNPYKDAKGKPRPIKFDDGVLYGDYRLPTEAEWEYAAYGYVLENPQPRRTEKARGEEVVANKQIYAWKNDGYDNLRSTKRGATQGAFLANFKRGSGDNMGVAGGLNDRSAIPAQIDAFFPNGFGVYNMSGNVSEWVSDVYRPLTSVEGDDFNYYRGNIFKRVKKDSATGEGTRDSLGRVVMENEPDSLLKKRRNYQKSYAIDYLDGDATLDGKSSVYNYGITTLISDKSRVVKGGSWNDRPFWLSPGARRFLEEDQSSSTIGFRCAMTHYGAPEGTRAATKTGNFFPARRAKR